MSTTVTGRARTNYRLRPLDIDRVVCHRHEGSAEQYLVRWKVPKSTSLTRAICSWHALGELSLCLHLVQSYIDNNPNLLRTDALQNTAQALHINRKRKLPGADPLPSRDNDGLLTPHDSAHLSREASVISISSSDAGNVASQSPTVYNGVLQKKAGRITAKRAKQPRDDADIDEIDATTLPTPAMSLAAAAVPITVAQHMIRDAFFDKLKDVPGVRLENLIDTTTPSLNFTFIKEFVLREGVYRADPETNVGCQKPCKPDMGQQIGCEYTKLCTCLEYAAVDESKLKGDEHRQYWEQKDNDLPIDTEGLPKRFPYRRPKPEPGRSLPSTLDKFYRDARHPIYECNPNCNCGPLCKSRVVQKGRKVPLTIFKTLNRGWGVKCDEDLIKGEFIDTYLGEVLTNKETDRREAAAGRDKASYLYNLDKHNADEGGPSKDTCYVVDGQYMGGPTRFINHSCEPNCRQYTVSYNKYDLWVYDLAFFVYENIPKGEELTFDYLDLDEEEEEEVVRKREAAAKDPKNADRRPCNCGATKCRGYLWD